MNFKNKSTVIAKSTPVALATALTALLMNGCIWDSGLYDDLVVNDGDLVRCPPVVILNDNRVLVNKDNEYSDLYGNSLENGTEKAIKVNNDGYLVSYKNNDEFVNAYGDVVDPDDRIKIGTINMNLKYSSKMNGKFDKLAYIDPGSMPVIDENDSRYSKYKKSFEYNLCPTEYSKCDFNEDNVGFYCTANNIGCSTVKDCEKDDGWADGKCENNKCFALKCNEGYHLTDSQCVENGALCCGFDDNGKCNVCDDVQTCDRKQGRCVSDCKEHEEICEDGNGKYCADFSIDNNNCGKCGHICETEKDTLHAETVKCDSSACIAMSCTTGYHMENGLCKENTDTDCGPNFMDCTSLKGWKDPKCDITQGKCVAEECDGENGYTLDDDKQCVAACIGVQVRCGNLCRDPLSDNEYCGAEGSITSCSNEGNNCTNTEGMVCARGICVQNDCAKHENTPHLCVVDDLNVCKKLDGDDAEHCGACNYKCAEHPIQNATSDSCSNGSCIYECSVGFVNVSSGTTADTIKCIDPQTNNAFCGASGSGEGELGETCNDGKVCVEGECKQNDCAGKSDTPNLCVINGKNDCKNIKSSDAEHCGACNYKCSEHAIQNATSEVCSNGDCQYACTTGFVNVSTGTTANTIKCIDPQTDNTYCGARNANELGTQCTDGKVCVEGECKQNDCAGKTETPNLCVVNGINDCKNIKGNDADHCGACNYKCSEHAIPNATSDTCSGGSCQYTCSTGYVNVSTGSTADTIKCIDPKSDNTYCGADSASSKGTTCTGGTVCVEGQCVTNKCSGDYPNLCVINGQNSCKNVNGSDADHCGTCNYKCSEHAIPNATSSICSGGYCQYSCVDGYVNVSTGTTANTIKCIDPKTDNNYCGATNSSAGKSCTGGKVCVEGDCVTNSCSGDKPNLCVIKGKNDCKNVNSSDADHCGTCNYKCSAHPIPNATSTTCSGGNCLYTCADGYVNVSTSGSTANTIKCIDPKADNNYCGATNSSVGIPCTGGKVCVEGKCVTNSCSGDKPDLCVVNGSNVCKNVSGSDADHCGACNYKCSAHPIPNATSTTCSGGACQYTCSTSFVNVSTNSTASTIKCIDPKTDNTYCGATSASDQGTTCIGGKVCVNGVCAINSCSGSTPDLCVVEGMNVCKNLSSDSEHCGACNNKCKTDQSCSSSKCVCTETSMTNCNGTCINTSNNADNCGECGYKCSSHIPPNAQVASTACSSSKCRYKCIDGFVNKGGDNANTEDTILCVSDTVECTSSQTNCNNVCLPTSMLSSAFHVAVNGDNCACVTGYGDANEDWSDGCECDLSTSHVYNKACEVNDNANCGSHNNACTDGKICCLNGENSKYECMDSCQ